MRCEGAPLRALGALLISFHLVEPVERLAVLVVVVEDVVVVVSVVAATGEGTGPRCQLGGSCVMSGFFASLTGDASNPLAPSAGPELGGDEVLECPVGVPMEKLCAVRLSQLQLSVASTPGPLRA